VINNFLRLFQELAKVTNCTYSYIAHVFIAW